LNVEENRMDSAFWYTVYRVTKYAIFFI